MTDILDLENWKAISVTKTDEEQTIEAEYLIQPHICQKCGVTDNLYKHGTKPVIYRDSPIRGLPVAIKAILKRYKCKSCGSTFLQPVTEIYPDTRMTNRCIRYIQTQCLRDTFTHISNHLGCDEKTIRNVASEYIDQLNAEYKPELPEWLGIDETTIDGTLRGVFTDVFNRTPIDMIKGRDKDSVIAWLRQFKDISRIQGVATDMCRPYFYAVNEVFPGIPIVVDKFHVVRMANNALEKVRIDIAKSKPKKVRVDWIRRKSLLRLHANKLNQEQDFNLSMWLDNEPDIKTAYDLKESFYKIYDAPDIDSASKLLDAWLASIPSHLDPYFKELTKIFEFWRGPILNYFNYRITNGYTEALNGIAKQLNRAGRGYNFETLRAKLLFHKNPVYTIGTIQKMMPRKALPGEHFSRYMCWSCGSIHYKKPAEVDLSRTNFGRMVLDVCVYLCDDCRRRLHTEE